MRSLPGPQSTGAPPLLLLLPLALLEELDDEVVEAAPLEELDDAAVEAWALEEAASDEELLALEVPPPAPIGAPSEQAWATTAASAAAPVAR